ncbi:2'-5' RNA ligase family protein [Nocardioides insulae]|uniref:2'-5' RNA ligase family protein n=1 Tax=Nocardioides insulae TaxID=394734 RepID=UPI0003FE1E7A|nr:2'-5' RNA ligase family protein [Nocardioides insulae]
MLVVPVPALEEYVAARTAHYDDSCLSADPAWVHAHITLLGPWLPDPAPADLARVGEVLSGVSPFEVKLGEVSVFPDGLIHLRPSPDEPFTALTRALAAAFPGYAPYAGRFPDPVPHLTLDQVGGAVSLSSVRADLADLLPVTLTVDRVDLQWWANHACRVLHSWVLTGRSRDHPSV